MSPFRAGLMTACLRRSASVAVLCAAAGCSDATRPGPGDGPPAVVPATDPAETALERQVRTHRWWTAPLAPERLRWLVGEVQATDPGRTFIFDSRGFQNARMATSAIRRPEDVAESGVPSPAWVSVRGGQRWAKEKALAELLTALDEAAERRSPK